jgi:hypothetical protein
MNCDSCGYIFYSNPPATAEVGNYEDERERTTDYAINVLYVIAFLTCGDGSKEAARVLGLLGLPNDITMESRSFGIIEERIGPTLQSVAEEILLDTLTEEVRLLDDGEMWSI